MANTTWNPADKSASVVLSNGNLTPPLMSSVGVRAIVGQANSKFYWEVTCNSWASTASSIGVTKSGVAFTSLPSSSAPGTGVSGVAKTGNVYADGGSIGTLGAIVTGNVICIALDCTAGLIWFRIGAAGNWNGSGTANPVTGVGGGAIHLGGAVAIYPTVWPNNTTEQATANFGDSAFTGAVPSGFTSGFPTTVASAVQARVMVLA